MREALNVKRDSETPTTILYYIVYPYSPQHESIYVYIDQTEEVRAKKNDCNDIYNDK